MNGLALDAADRAAHVVVEVGEGLRRPRRLDPGVLLSRSPRKPSSVKVSIPQSVWWMRTISSVPSSRCEIASERISSSVTTPPALRITCASPMLEAEDARGRRGARPCRPRRRASWPAAAAGRPCRRSRRTPRCCAAARRSRSCRAKYPKAGRVTDRGRAPRLRGHMPELIESPSRVEAAGTKPKLIDEYAGRVNNGETRVSVAHMRSPAGWVEPGQRPEFDEYTLVLGGALRRRARRRRRWRSSPARPCSRAPASGSATRRPRAPSTSRSACRRSPPTPSIATSRETGRDRRRRPSAARQRRDDRVRRALGARGTARRCAGSRRRAT